MAEKKRADQYAVGEEFDSLDLLVTDDFNRQFLEAVEDLHPRYIQHTEDGPPIVHPALLVNQSNVTRSPSFYLPPGMAAVHAKEEVRYINPARIGRILHVHWKVVDVYEKRGRPYQVKEMVMVDDDGTEILHRMITDTFIQGSDRRASIS
jgi:hypothetical protein